MKEMINKNTADHSPDTLDEWSAQGMNRKNGQQFAQDINQIAPLKLFIRSLPQWCKKYDTSALIKITAKPEWEGVGIEFGFNKKKLSTSEANELTEIMINVNRLMELEFLVENMKGLGVSAEIINKLVDEADELAKKISGSL